MLIIILCLHYDIGWTVCTKLGKYQIISYRDSESAYVHSPSRNF